MGSLEFGFKLIIFFFQKSMRILFTNRALPTIRRMDKILGNVSPSPYCPKITVAYGELRIYFSVQIPPFIGWTWIAEMTLRLQVDLVLSDAASPAPVRHILFNRCCHFAYGDSDVAKMRTAPGKCNIYTKWARPLNQITIFSHSSASCNQISRQFLFIIVHLSVAGGLYPENMHIYILCCPIKIIILFQNSSSQFCLQVLFCLIELHCSFVFLMKGRESF